MPEVGHQCFGRLSVLEDSLHGGKVKNILKNHNIDELTFLNEADNVLPLTIGQDQLVPFVLLQPQTLQAVVLDEVHPDTRKLENYLGYLQILPFIMTFTHCECLDFLVLVARTVGLQTYTLLSIYMFGWYNST